MRNERVMKFQIHWSCVRLEFCKNTWLIKILFLVMLYCQFDITSFQLAILYVPNTYKYSLINI